MINVFFLGKEYNFPDDIFLWFDTTSVAFTASENLIKEFREKAQKSDTGIVSSEYLHSIMEQQAKLFVEKLCQNGIYNKTIEDYAFNNDGYKICDELNTKVYNAVADFYENQLSQLKTDLQNARLRAESSVTGTGMRVWSSSALTLATTAAMEYSALNKQIKDAGKQYEAEASELFDYYENNRDKKVNDFLAKHYYPKMESALSIAAYCMMERFLDDMSEHGKFDKDCLKYLDVTRSNNLLHNLDISPEKAAILCEAFQIYPFNLQVYFEAAKLGLIGAEEITTIKQLRQDDIFNSKVMSCPKCGKKYLYVETESCPKCGERIKNIFIQNEIDRLKQEKLKLLKEANENENRELIDALNRHEEIYTANSYELLEKISPPQKPSAFPPVSSVGCVTAIFIPISGLTSLLSALNDDFGAPFQIFFTIFSFSLLVYVILWVNHHNETSDDRKQYQYDIEHLEEYKTRKMEEIKEKEIYDIKEKTKKKYYEQRNNIEEKYDTLIQKCMDKLNG